MSRSSPICVDANLVVRLVAAHDDVVIDSLWQQWQTEQRHFAAPTLLRYEVTNALYRLSRAAPESRMEMQQALLDALALPIELHQEEDLHPLAMEFAARFDLPAAYDAHYLALANLINAEFWTSDRRLARIVSAELPWVHLVSA